MEINCQKCGFVKRVDDSKIPDNCVSVKCPKCKDPILLKKDAKNPVDQTEVTQKEAIEIQTMTPISKPIYDANKGKNINRMNGEEVLWREKADVLFVSPNLIVKIIVKFIYIMGWLLGIRHKGDITCTNKRLIYEIKSYFLWIFNYKSKFQTIYLNKLSGIDVGYEASFLIFFKSKIMTVYSSGMTAPTFAFKKISEEDLFHKIAKITDLNLSYAA